jgi:spore germination protein
MIPQNAVQMYQFIEFVGRAGLVITIAYPALLLGVAWIRKLREDQREGKTLE